jgi:hypothetical protein
LAVFSDRDRMVQRTLRLSISAWQQSLTISPQLPKVLPPRRVNMPILKRA